MKMSVFEGYKLLFFDTFSHDVMEELNLDLVQFPGPVIVDEIRIIPLGVKVQANLPGGMRLGATNPTRINLDFFVNDLSKSGASTFESIGSLLYVDTELLNLNCVKKIVTDGLVLRGVYNAITIAVYGKLSKNTSDEMASKNKQDPLSNESLNSQIYNDHQLNNVSHSHDARTINKSVEICSSGNDKESITYKKDFLMPCNNLKSEASANKCNVATNGQIDGLHKNTAFIESKNTVNNISDNINRKSLSSDETPKKVDRDHNINSSQNGFFTEIKTDIEGDMSDISEGDIPDSNSDNSCKINDDSKMETCVVEEISDDEAEWSDEILENCGIGEFDYDNWEDPIKIFNCYDAVDVELTALSCMNGLREKSLSCFECPSEFDTDNVKEKFRFLLKKFFYEKDKKQILSDLVDLNEFVIDNVVKIYPIEDEEGDKLDEMLLELSRISRRFEYALDQPVPTYKVRQIKSGLELTLTLMLCSDNIMRILVSDGIQSELLALFIREHMATSIQLLIIKILDLTLDHIFGLDSFVETRSCVSWCSPYKICIDLLSGKYSMRIKSAISSLISKVSLYNTLDMLNKAIQAITCMDDTINDAYIVIDNCLQYILGVYKGITVEGSYWSTNKGLTHDGFFHAIHNKDFLQMLILLLSQPNDTISASIMNGIYSVLDQFLNHYRGIVFMASQTMPSNYLMRILLDVQCGSEDNEVEMFEEYQCRLGLRMVHCIHAVKCVDSLFFFLLKNRKSQLDVENMTVLEIVSSLYGMTFTNIGKFCVSHVLSQANFLDVILYLLKSKNEVDITPKKSAVRSYASRLLVMVVQNSENVAYLDNFMPLLVELSNQGSLKLDEVSAWIGSIYDVLRTSTDEISSLCHIVRQNVDNVSPISKELITAVRMLLAKCNKKENWSRGQINHNIFSMYSNDLVEQYILIANNIYRLHDQPHLHVATFSAFNGFLILAVLKPMVKTLHQILKFLFLCHGSGVKDVRPVSILLKIYTIASVIPTSSLCYQQSKSVGTDVLETIALFTQTSIESLNENINESIWKSMLTEVITYIISAPHTYVLGLECLSYLLPLPLPMLSKSTLLTEEHAFVIRSRKLWAVHILSVKHLIIDMIKQLALSSCPSLLQRLRRVCVQLADLSPHISSAICKMLLDEFYDSTYEESAKWLNLISLLVSTATIKIAILDLQKDNNLFWDKLREILTPTPSIDNPHDSICQEYIILILQIFCDCEVSLVPIDSGTSESCIANSMPNASQLELIVLILIDFASKVSSDVILLGPLRALLLLTDCSYGCVILWQCLEKRPLFLTNLIRKFGPNLVEQSSDCIRALSNVVELISSFLPIDCDQFHSDWSTDEVSHLIDRTNPVNPIAVLEKEIIIGESGDENYDDLHILKEQLVHLKKMLEMCCNVNLTSEQLRSRRQDTLVRWPTSDSLFVQFESRPIQIFYDGEGEERLNVSYWFSSHGGDSIDESEFVNVNLMDLSSDLFSKDFDIHAEVLQECNEKYLNNIGRKKKLIKRSLLEVKAQQNKNIISTYRDGGAASLFQKKFGVLRTGHRQDMFRARLTNTSRLPSLHVDDFLQLQIRGQQPKAPTGYNKESIKAANELFGTQRFPSAVAQGSGRRVFGHTNYGRIFNRRNIASNYRNDRFQRTKGNSRISVRDNRVHYAR